jgi:putative membrane-bound dehydrogenase-like protein
MTYGHEFVAPFNTEQAQNASMSAEDVCKTIQLPPGFKLAAFAQEPDVQNPISLTTDERGRLWVAENYSWAGARDGNFEPKLRDRIVILSDEDGDGRMDRRQVFWDQAERLTSVEVGFGGVWALCSPQLLFIPDKDRNDVPDGPPVVILDGFDIHSVQHTVANGLKWGPDGWLYGRQGILGTSHIGPPGASPQDRVAINTGVWRVHPVDGRCEAVMHGMTNPWGFDFDAVGEMFVINTVIGHLWHVVPGARTERMSGLDFNPHAYQLIRQTADHVHWDTGDTWDAVRNGVTGATNSAGGGHAHTGLLIYQGDNWPASFHGKAYTLNIHGRRINCDHLQQTDVGYKATHGQDMAMFQDPWFRGIDLINSPDGGVYIADWSDTGECHEMDGVHRTSGRIYKLSYGQPERKAIDLAALDDAALVDLQRHPNDWFTRQARRLLQQRAANGQSIDPEAVRRLTHLYYSDSDRVLRLRALWTLFLVNQAAPDWLVEQLQNEDEHVRSWSIRFLVENCQTLASQPELLQRIVTEFTARAGAESSGLPLLHLAAALQRLPIDSRWSIGTVLASRPEPAFAKNRTLSIMVWLALEPVVASDFDKAAALLRTTTFPLVRENTARRLASDLDLHPQGVEDALAIAAESKALAPQIVAGLVKGLAGRRDCSVPANWPAVYDQLSTAPREKIDDDLTTLAVIFRDAKVLGQLRRLAGDTSAATPTRVRALELVLTNAPQDFGPELRRLADDPAIAVDAIRGLALYDDEQLRSSLLADYGTLRAPARAAVIDLLASRPESARALMKAIEDKRIPSGDVSVVNVRHMLAFNDEPLSQAIQQHWGDIRSTPQEKQALITAYKARLGATAISQGDLKVGQAVFTRTCAGCHKLFGEGGDSGPDLTGSDRKNLDYMLQNIVDPSAIVAAGHRATMFFTTEGRVVTGIVRERSPHTVVVENQQGRQTLELRDIEKSKPTNMSLMPDGILETLSEAQVRDLFAYLMSK